jgi:hypothetical protein
MPSAQPNSADTPFNATPQTNQAAIPAATQTTPTPQPGTGPSQFQALTSMRQSAPQMGVPNQVYVDGKPVATHMFDPASGAYIGTMSGGQAPVQDPNHPSGLYDPGQPPAGGGGQHPAVSLIQSSVSDISDIAKSLGPTSAPDAQAVFMQQAQGILQLIQKEEDQLRSNAQAQGQTVDAATQYTLTQLQKTLGEHLQATQEELNKRGLFNSGVLLDLEQKLRSGEGTEEAKILGTRLDEIQKTLQTGLANLAHERVSTLTQFGMKAGEAQTTANQNALTRQQQLIETIYKARNDAAIETQRVEAAAQLKQQELAAAAQQGDANRANALRLDLTRLQAEAVRAANSEAAANQRAQMAEGAAAARQQASEAGANYRNAATIAAEGARQQSAQQFAQTEKSNPYFVATAISDASKFANATEALGWAQRTLPTHLQPSDYQQVIDWINQSMGGGGGGGGRRE